MNVSHVGHSEGFGMGVSMNCFLRNVARKGKKTFFWIAQVSWMLHLYWHLYLSFLENVTSYGIDEPTINAAEAIGVLTNVSPVRHTEVYGWDVNTVSHRMWTGKNWIEVKCQGTSICSPVFLPFGDCKSNMISTGR